jgi:hypothetical protein
MEKKYTVRLVSNSYFIKKVDAHTAAISSFPSRQIYLRKEYFDISTILHEVMHCYMYECHITGTSLTAAKVEELACEIVGERVMDVIYTAVSIYRQLGGRKIKLKELHQALENLEKLWD